MNKLFENVDADIESFPWHFPEQYILSDFLQGGLAG